MIPCHEKDIDDQAVDLLIQQYKDKPVIEAIVRSYARRCQELEHAAWDVINSRLLGEVYVLFPRNNPRTCEEIADTSTAEEGIIKLTATGVRLDLVGKIVGEARLGRSDADYEVGIKIRIAINRSNGRSDDLIEICALAGPLEKVTYSDGDLFSWQIEVYEFENVVYLAKGLGKAKAAGSKGNLIYSFAPVAQALRLSSTYGSVIPTPLGFSSVYGGATGGKLAGVLETIA